jgi:cysteine desulfurase
MKNKVIYLDNAATTKVDKRVIDVMIPFMSDFYSNPSSLHQFGIDTNIEIEKARAKVAQLISSETSELTFTSGATESINTILKGITSINNSERNEIIIASTEHSAVIDTCNYLENIGIDITILPVQTNGLIDIEFLEKKISQKTLLVCVMLVNNETGVIQPISEISKIAHHYGAMILTDATQGVGKITVNVKELEVDFLVFSGHKIYGPKGIGVHFIKKGTKNFNPLIHGGNHEKGKRSGTLNVPSIIGIGTACQIAIDSMEEDKIRIEKLRNILEEKLLKIHGTEINGDRDFRIFNITNIYFPNAEADIVIKLLENVCVSNGSACTSAVIQASHVLKAMGLSDKKAFSSIRFSLGKFNTLEEIEYTVLKFKKLYNMLLSN